MAAAVTYTNFGGMLVHEDRGGVERQYIGDPLGSLVGELDENQTLTYTAEYWPYGEVRTESGTKQSEWGYVGLLGYLKDFASLLYVRARHYMPHKSRWLTVDPLWPGQRAYCYAYTRPLDRSDRSGLGPQATEEMARSAIAKACMAAQLLGALEHREDIYSDINDCVRRCRTDCPNLTRKMMLCLQRYACGNHSLQFNKGRCLSSSSCAYVEAPNGVREGGCTRMVGAIKIFICARCTSTGCNPLGHGVPVTDAVIHEILHCCGLGHGGRPEPLTCNSILTCCILKKVGRIPPTIKCCA